MVRGRTGVRLVQRVVAALVLHRRAGLPQAANHRDRLIERVDELAARPRGSAHRGHRFEEVAGSQAELHAPRAEDVERRGRARDDRGRSQRDVQHVGEEVDALCLRGHVGEQRPRVQECRLIWVILDAEEVEPETVRELGEIEDLFEVARARRDTDSEKQVVLVIRHPNANCPLPACGRGGRSASVPSSRSRSLHRFASCSDAGRRSRVVGCPRATSKL